MHLSSVGNSANFAAGSLNNTRASTAVGPDVGCAHGYEKRAGRTHGAGGLSNLVSSVFQALAQTAATTVTQPAATGAPPTTPDSTAVAATPATGDAAATPAPAAAGGVGPTMDMLQKISTFMQGLFAAMGQAGGHGHHGHSHHHHHGHGEPAGAISAPGTASPPVIAVLPAATPTAAVPGTSAGTSTDTAVETSAGTTSTSPARLYQHHAHGGGLVAKLQSLLQQVTDGNASANASGPLADLNNAFQSLFSTLHPAENGSPAAQPSLQDFLQKLVQNISGGTTNSVAATGHLINATA